MGKANLKAFSWVLGEQRANGRRNILTVAQAAPLRSHTVVVPRSCACRRHRAAEALSKPLRSGLYKRHLAAATGVEDKERKPKALRGAAQQGQEVGSILPSSFPMDACSCRWRLPTLVQALPRGAAPSAHKSLAYIPAMTWDLSPAPTGILHQL